jgi:hypothetical protein
LVLVAVGGDETGEPVAVLPEAAHVVDEPQASDGETSATRSSDERWSGRARLLRRRRLVLTATAVSAVLVATAAVVVVVTRSGPAARYHATSPIAAQIDQIAIDDAAGSGDPNVASVTWVPAPSRAEAGGALMDSPGLEGHDPVYALEMRGSFVNNALVPLTPSTLNESAPVLVMIIDAKNMLVTDWGLQAYWADLSSLGSPETDSLVGLTPSSRSR